MLLSLSTHLLVYSPLERRTLDSLQKTPYSVLEVWLAEPHVPWRSADSLSVFRDRLHDHGLRAGSVHLPFYPSVPELLHRNHRWSVVHADPNARSEALEGTLRGLEAAANLQASRAVLHLGWQKDPWDQTTYELAREAVGLLLPVAKQLGIELLLENIISDGTRCAQLVQLLDELDPAGDAGICLDLGHAHVEGEIMRQLEDSLPRLRHLHVHDNNGLEDSHLAPGCGTIPWQLVLQRLTETGFRGQAALEIRDPSKGNRPSGEVIREQIELIRDFEEYWRAQGLI